jgi:hypothetical protein
MGTVISVELNRCECYRKISKRPVTNFWTEGRNRELEAKF